MDEAGLHQRRAALKGRLRRRRLAVSVAALALVAVLSIVVTSGGNDRRPADRRAPAHAGRANGPRTASSAQPPAVIRTVSMPGAHRAPHEAVPILMYHVIGIRPPGTPNPTLWVSPTDFAAHIRALKAAGYHTVTLAQVWNAWHHAGKLPRKPLVLSFDDGYLGQVRFAMPTLARQGWAGVLNLKLGNLKDMGGTRAIKRMIRAGWEVDSHTITHPDLTTLGAQQLHDELVGSRTRLKRYFHVAVSFFCFPSGRYDDRVIAAVKDAGYRAATTTQLGWARPGADPFTLPRVRIDGGMSAQAVLARIRDVRAGSGG